MLVACLGDIMLDVIVETPGGLVPDDDAPARITFTAGGQAANVAAWATALGARARLFGPRSDTAQGRMVEESLTAQGIEVYGPNTSRAGSVMSLVDNGRRSLASDPGSTDWLEHIGPGPWLDDVDWLFVSGYALLRSTSPEHIVEVAQDVRANGARVAIDLSSASMIGSYGAARFRDLWQRLRPAVIFANDDEWTATHSGTTHAPVSSFGAGGTSVLVLKHGERGCTFVIDGIADDRDPVHGTVADVTGAGDSIAAGYLVGGVDLAMQTAARCVAHIGAQPPLPDRSTP